MKKTIRVIALVAAVLLVAAIGFVAVFWDTLAIYITPKAVLTQSISYAVSQLQVRFEKNPVKILIQGMDPAGKQNAEIRLQTEDAFLGSLEYDMTLQSQPNQVFAEGIVYTDSNDLDLSVYMDTNFMAVSSDDLVQGSYYGITFDTFQEDIHKIPLLSWLIGDSLIAKWDQSIDQIQANMRRTYAVPQLPEVTEGDMRMAMLALMAAPSDVEKTTILVQGRELECHRITYALSGSKVLEALRQVAALESAESAELTAAFYLSEKTLVLADIQITAGEAEYRFQLESGMDILNDPLAVTVSCRETENADQTVIRFTASEAAEQWDIQRQTQTLSVSYRWDPVTGDMELTRNGFGPVALNLTETEDGFCVKSEDFSKLYSVITGVSQSENSRLLRGSMVIRKGADFTVPGYKNLDQWSMDDFLTLLEGLGGLIGIPFA